MTKEHITAPTGIAVSPEGVVFVSCDINGTTSQRRKVGKVVRCEDTDGDGVADKFSNFVEGIDSPRGSCYVDDTLYLMQTPLLVAYQDLDGDDVAEKKTVLVTNLGPPFHQSSGQHGPNGITMGIDGWLYLAMGDQGCFGSNRDRRPQGHAPWRWRSPCPSGWKSDQRPTQRHSQHLRYRR